MLKSLNQSINMNILSNSNNYYANNSNNVSNNGAPFITNANSQYIPPQINSYTTIKQNLNIISTSSSRTNSSINNNQNNSNTYISNSLVKLPPISDLIHNVYDQQSTNAAPSRDFVAKNLTQNSDNTFGASNIEKEIDLTNNRDRRSFTVIPSVRQTNNAPFLERRIEKLPQLFQCPPSGSYQFPSQNTLQHAAHYQVPNQTSQQHYVQKTNYQVNQEFQFSAPIQVNSYNTIPHNQNFQPIFITQRPHQQVQYPYELSSYSSNNFQTPQYLATQGTPMQKIVQTSNMQTTSPPVPLQTPNNVTPYVQPYVTYNNDLDANINKTSNFENELMRSMVKNNVIQNAQIGNSNTGLISERKVSFRSERTVSSPETSINSINSRKNSTDQNFSTSLNNNMLIDTATTSDLKHPRDSLNNTNKRTKVSLEELKSKKGVSSKEKKKVKDIDIINNVFTNEVSKDNENKTTLKANKIYTVNFTNAVKLRKQCPICGKICSRPSTLKTHYLIHTGDTPFNCTWPNCKKSFNVKSNMLRHVKSHARKLEKQQRKLNNLAIKRE